MHREAPRLAALGLLVLPAAGQADVELRFSDGTVALVSEDRVAFGDGQDRILVESGADSMIVLNARDRTWVRLTPGFVTEIAERMRAQVEGMLADLPAEQREEARAQLDEMLPRTPSDMPEMSLERTGESDEVAGYRCEEAEIRYDGGDVEETVCIASVDELDIEPGDFDALVAAMQSMADMDAVEPGSIPQADFAAMNGIPIRTRAADEAVISELVGLETGEIDPAELRVPDDYREITLEEMLSR